MSMKHPSRRNVRESQCPSLPPEVWINIFRYHTDLAHLWIVCRRVSSVLRSCVEYAFGEYFLKDIHIDFQLEKYNLGGKSKRPEVPVEFDRLGQGNEKEIAWYRDRRPEDTISGSQGGGSLDHYNRVMRRWEENVNGWRLEMPNYTISISNYTNDTALPGLQIDIAKREIQFEWRKMLHLFFREHERLRTLQKAWQLETTRTIQANNQRLTKGEKLMPADFPPPWSTAELRIRKYIRRARLKEHYRDNEEMIWAINSLRHFEEYGATTGTTKALKLDVDLPGAGLGGKWFGSANLTQELYLDEWSCIHRIDTKIEHLRSEG